MPRLTYDLVETLQMMPRQYAGQVVIPEELRDTLVEELTRLYGLEEEVTGGAPEQAETGPLLYKYTTRTVN